MKKPLVRKRDGGWQVVLPAREFGFNPAKPSDVILVSGMAQPADCVTFLRTYNHMTVHEGYFSLAESPQSSGFTGEGYRPVVR